MYEAVAAITRSHQPHTPEFFTLKVSLNGYADCVPACKDAVVFGTEAQTQFFHIFISTHLLQVLTISDILPIVSGEKALRK